LLPPADSVPLNMFALILKTVVKAQCLLVILTVFVLLINFVFPIGGPCLEGEEPSVTDTVKFSPRFRAPLDRARSGFPL